VEEQNCTKPWFSDISPQLFWGNLQQRRSYQRHFTGGVSTSKSLQSLLTGSRGSSDKACPFPLRNKEKRSSNCRYKGFFPVQQQALTEHLLGRRDGTASHTLTAAHRLGLCSAMLLSTSAAAPLRHLEPYHFPFDAAPASHLPSLDCQIFGNSVPACSMLFCKAAPAASYMGTTTMTWLHRLPSCHP